MSGNDSLLEITDLSIEYGTRKGPLRAVSDASFSIGANEYFGLVGESGCGKSTIAKAILNNLDSNGRVSAGEIRYRGTNLLDLTEKEYDDQFRWNEISIIPQSAMNSLNPIERISKQAWEIAEAHTDWTKEETLDELRELFDVVGLPEARIHDYPYQFSGGMKQRAVIALSFLLKPSLVVADEPTTALDVIMQDQFLKYVDEVREVRDSAILMITHDIAVVFELCDTLGVMHGGQVAETGSTEHIVDNPRHPYSILLQQAFPDHRFPDRQLEEITGAPPSLTQDVDFCTFVDRCPWAQPECSEGAPPLENVDDRGSHRVACIRENEMESLAGEYLDDLRDRRERSAEHLMEYEVYEGNTTGQVTRSRDTDPVIELRELEKHFDPEAGIVDTIKSLFSGNERELIRAVDGVNLQLEKNQVQGIIGESGCGKSTLLFTLMGKYGPTGGDFMFNGQSIDDFSRADWKEYRRNVQIIFQDPFNTINPHFTVRQTLAEPLKIHDIEYDEERLFQTLENVELTPPEKYIDRYESQLSGGEKQRVAIARALILEPDVILADEPVSMLDVSTQASILRLLQDLTREYGVSMLYVSHDLSTVSYVCDRINVMYLGRIVESSRTRELIKNPKHPYTNALLKAIPIPDPHFERGWEELAGTPADPSALPQGCRFKDRCPERMEICDVRPEFQEFEGEVDRQVACHLYYDHDEAADELMATPGTQGGVQ